MRKSGPDPRQPLQEEEALRGESLRLPIESPQDLPLRSAELIAQEPRHPRRLFRLLVSRATARYRIIDVG